MIEKTVQPTYIGFDGQTPYSVIGWFVDGVIKRKTVCYDEKEQQDVLAMYHNKVGLYGKCDGYTVQYPEAKKCVA
ncbi:hypothetical protein [Viridibacillus sp. FSL H8-0123]|uniref:hypothetical protein n=1 Tax=Viridibacillus sp. FSL H8-0123 TaxID=1928922 RepID=UPI00096DEC17|nr:hypothetical protein [Viridibacillus sp. FSL H8-0123]OMC83338.1 hypothetical protein BK130_07255 [Viridibacillus sp. FSL H8-0123]